MSQHMRTHTLVALVLVLSNMASAANPKDFTLYSPTHDKTFRLSEHKGKIVVLHFLLKTECPFCLKYTHQYAELADKNPNVIHLFLKPDSDAEIKAWAEKLDAEDLSKLPVIYRDPDASLATQFGIADGYKFHGQTVHYPALVVLDGNHEELFRYVGKSNADRLKTTDFVKKLAGTKGPQTEAIHKD